MGTVHDKIGSIGPARTREESASHQATARSRLLLDQRTPAEYEHSIEARKAKRRLLGIFIGAILLLLICGGIVFYLFFYENILEESDNDTNNDNGGAWTIRNISLATGFKIEEYVKNNEINKFHNPRSMHMSQYNGATIVYVGSIRYQYSLTDPSYVYALIDENSDGQNDYIRLIYEGNMNSRGTPSIAIDNDTQLIYIDDMNGFIYRCENVHEQVLAMTSQNDRLNFCQQWATVPIGTKSHNLHYMSINPITHQLCMSFGVSGNIIIPDPPEGAIRCFNSLDPGQTWQDTEIYADGVRNSVGFQFHPITNDLWFTDNGADGLGDDEPDDELNKVSYIGEYFGFPACHSGGYGPPILRDTGPAFNIIDHEFGYLANDTCDEDENTPAIQALGPHVAALGMKFVFNDSLPAPYYRMIVIAQHGSWDRSTLIGYRVMAAFLVGENFDQITGYGVLADGWLVDATQTQYGRPSDIETLPDGSILVSDDDKSIIYRIYYDVRNEDEL